MALAASISYGLHHLRTHEEGGTNYFNNNNNNKRWHLQRHASLVLLQHASPTQFNAVRILAAATVEVCSLDTKEKKVTSADLPCSVNDTITVESWGSIFEGPGEEKYWKYSRNKKCYPYPVGYTATKVYKGRKFRQTVVAGTDGPLFSVMEIGGETYSSDSASKAWSQTIQNGSIRVHGNRHFGFESPLVQKVLYDMIEQHQMRSLQTDAIHEETNIVEAEGGHISINKEDKFVKELNVSNEFSQKGIPHAHESKVFLDKESPLSKQSEVEVIQQAFQNSLPLEKDNGYKRSGIKESSRSSVAETFETVIDSMSTMEGLITDASNIRSKGSMSTNPIRKERTKTMRISNDETHEIFSRTEQFSTNSVGELSILDVESPIVEEGIDLIKLNDKEISALKQDADSSRPFLTLLHKWNEVKEKKQISNGGTDREKATNSFSKVENQEKGKVVDDAVLGKHAIQEKRQITRHVQDMENGAIYKVDSQIFETPDDINGFVSISEESFPNLRTEGLIYNITKPYQEMERNTSLDQQRKGGTGLVAEIKELISDKKFERALTTLRNLKLSGVEIDDFIYEAFFPFRFDLWQKQVREELRDGSSVLVCAPGGAGKLAAAECIIYENLVKNQRALFVTPFEESAKQQLKKFQLMFGSSNVGAVWSRMEIQKDAPLIVLTLDTLVKIVREKNGPGGSEYCFFFEGITMAVFDKFHTIGDMTFGGLWEEVFMLMNPQVKFVALSLPVSNVHHVVSWINSIQRACRLVECISDPVPKRFLFSDGSGLVPLLSSKETKMDSILREKYALNSCNEMKQETDGSFYSYDRLCLRNVLQLLESKLMLPAVVIFFHHEECNTAFEDATEVFKEGLLSVVEAAEVESRLAQFLENHPEFHHLVDEADQKGLLYGFVTYHEGKIPLWLHFLDELIEKNLVKFIITTARSICQTNISVRSIIFPVTYRITEDGISLISASEFLYLKGVAGRRRYDTEGNVIFLKTLYTTPMEAVSLVLTNHVTICSHFKPSYSLLLNLLAKHNLPKVKQILEQSFCDFIPAMHVKEHQKMEDNLQKCLDAKNALEIDLFQELARINKDKLKDAAMFTRLDIRLKTVSTLESADIIPGVLLAVLPGVPDIFYLVLGIDNQYRLLPAGAFDHVYTNTEPTFDVIYKRETGQTLHTPYIPPKEEWTVDYEGGIGYIASGGPESIKFSEMIKQHPTHDHHAKEAYQIRKQIQTLESQIFHLRRQRDIPVENMEHEPKETSRVQKQLYSESPSWKKCENLLEILKRADAFSFAENQVAYIKLKPLGVLISRLHHVENELWISMAISLDSVKSLSPPEFAGIAAALLSDQVGRTTGQRELTYRVSKRLQATLVELEALRKQVACIQGSYRPSLHLNAATAGMVYSWARGKPGLVSFELAGINDGGMVLILKRIAAFTSLVHQACTDTSVDASVSAFASVAKRAELLLSRYISSVS